MTTVERIELELNKKGIKAAKMSKDLGFSSGLFSQWKSGAQKPSASSLEKVAKYFNVSIDYLKGNNEQSIEDIVKTYLFGTTDIDDIFLNHVKQYAKFLLKERSDNMYIPTPDELENVNISEDCKHRVYNGDYLYESEAEEIANSLCISIDKIIGNRKIIEDRKSLAKMHDYNDSSPQQAVARDTDSTAKKPNTDVLSSASTMNNE